jgi:radical SAM superfamily enzyme YgiQ (UPF0313 family)
MNIKAESIALVNVYFTESGYGDRLHTPPLGVGYISEYLNKKNVKNYVIDMGLGYTKDQIVQKIKKLHTAAVGFSINSLCMEKTADLIKAVKTSQPSALMIVGGPHVSTIKESILNECPLLDYAIIGEGEESLYQLLKGNDPESIAGLIYRDDAGKIKVNHKRITENIDTLPFPKFTQFELDKYADKSMPLLSSRGCPFKCMFCQQSSLLSKNWRGKSAAFLGEEIKYWIRKGYKEFQILDDNFAYDADRLHKITFLFAQNNISNISISIVGGVRISSMTKERLMLLRRIGVDFISFGIESFSDKVLRFIKKGTNTKKIEKVVRMATEMGFKVRLFFIIGLPYETMESLDALFGFVLKYPIYQVRFFNLVPYQRTALMDWIEENGKLLYPPQEYMNNFKKFQDIPIFTANNTMGIKERKQALIKARHISEVVYERFMANHS